MKPKGDLHLMEYRNPDNGRRHRMWLFHRQSPAPDTSAVDRNLMTAGDGHMILVSFDDKNGGHHCHRYPMANIARIKAAPAVGAE